MFDTSAPSQRERDSKGDKPSELTVRQRREEDFQAALLLLWSDIEFLRAKCGLRPATTQQLLESVYEILAVLCSE
jgi:hypothetical protein